MLKNRSMRLQIAFHVFLDAKMREWLEPKPEFDSGQINWAWPPDLALLRHTLNFCSGTGFQTSFLAQTWPYELNLLYDKTDNRLNLKNSDLTGNTDVKSCV